MKRLDIEEWAYRVVSAADRRQPIEDDRVELKAHWPEARDIARQLGGHANTARGEDILWLIGIDEKQGAVGTQLRDVAAWRAQLEAEFEGGAPIADHLTLEWKGVAFAAFAFRTDAPPYVVRNPKRNEPASGPFELEVPWRDGRTRAARRAELVLLLRPVARLPTIEALSGEIRMHPDGSTDVKAYFYVATDDARRVLVPRAKGELTLGPYSFELPEVQLNPDGNDPDVIGTRSHLSVNGAGKILCIARINAQTSLDLGRRADLEVRLYIATEGRELVGHAKLDRVEPDRGAYALWLLGHARGA